MAIQGSGVGSSSLPVFKVGESSIPRLGEVLYMGQPARRRYAQEGCKDERLALSERLQNLSRAKVFLFGT